MIETLLHLGIEWHHFPNAWSRMRHHRASLLLDRWDAWGELLEVKPRTPFGHVVVIGTSAEHDTLVEVLNDVLCSQPDDTCIAVETRIEDWDVEEAGGRIWHRLPHGAETMTVVEVHPWR